MRLYNYYTKSTKNKFCTCKPKTIQNYVKTGFQRHKQAFFLALKTNKCIIFEKKFRNILEVQKKHLPLQPQTRNKQRSAGENTKAGPFVYRLGREIFIL